MNILELSEQEIVRRQSLEQMRALGVDPYPAAEYPVTGHTDEIKENFVDLPVGADGNPVGEPRQVSIAGRVMGRRIMGESLFYGASGFVWPHTGLCQSRRALPG